MSNREIVETAHRLVDVAVEWEQDEHKNELSAQFSILVKGMSLSLHHMSADIDTILSLRILHWKQPYKKKKKGWVLLWPEFEAWF